MIDHLLKNALLVWLSLLCLPLDTFILLTFLARRTIWGSKRIQRRQRIRQDVEFRPRKVLVTGIGMTKGLVLARAFYEAGHDVIGADFGATPCGRVSFSLIAFHSLPRTRYFDTLKSIIVAEGVELWVSCSGVVSAVEDGEAKERIEKETACIAIQFNAADTEMLHEKDSFIRCTSEIGLLVPDTHTVTSRDEVMKVLEATSKEYILKPIGVDDARRADMTKLRSGMKRQYVSKLSISKRKPYILQQFIQGEEYCTQALVIRGNVVAFVACPSAELLMHYRAIPPGSPLSLKMLEFTRCWATHGNFTGHLSFDFIVQGEELFPIECNPRCHTAVVLFRDESEKLAAAYISALDHRSCKLLTPSQPAKYYWQGHDLVTFLLQPWSLSQLISCINHLLYWKDGTFEAYDPMPWWWLYHVYWPLEFLKSIWKSEYWSRVNVSTTKMFKC